MTEVFRFLDKVLQQAADKSWNGKLTREKAIEIINKTQFFGKERFLSEDIVDKIKEMNENYVGGRDLISEEQEIEPREMSETIYEYAKQNVLDVGKGKSNPEGFMKYARQKMADPNTPEPERRKLAGTLAQMEQSKEKFEKTERESYEEWLVDTLQQEGDKVKDSDYYTAVEHLKYRDADTLQFRVMSEGNKPCGISFRIKSLGEWVTIKTIGQEPTDAIKDVKLDDLEQAQVAKNVSRKEDSLLDVVGGMGIIEDSIAAEQVPAAEQSSGNQLLDTVLNLLQVDVSKNMLSSEWQSMGGKEDILRQVLYMVRSTKSIDERNIGQRQQNKQEQERLRSK